MESEHRESVGRRAYQSQAVLGSSVCLVSTGGFGGVWRTRKQAVSLAEAGARVIIVGYKNMVPPALQEGPCEAVLVDDTSGIYRASEHPVRPIRIALNLFIHRPANAWRARRGAIARHMAHRALTEAVAATGADIVQAVDLPALDCAAEAAGRIGARLVYASHEWWPGFVANPDMNMDPQLASALLAVEARRIRSADLVTVTSDVMGERLAARYGIARPLTILNAPGQRVEAARAAGSPVRLVFHGGLSADRNIDGLIRAMALLQGRATLDIHGFGRTIDPAVLQGLVDELDLGDTVVLHGPFEYSEVVDLLRDYDVGVMSNRVVEENFDVTLPNKVFDCMCAGVAIAMGESQAVRAILADVPFGITLDPSTPETIARDLGTLIDDPERIMAMKQAAVDASARYWWPEQGRKLVAAFGDMLATR